MVVQVSRRRLDVAKAVEVLLYVTAKVHNMYVALKVIYFADKMHLQRHARFIYDETYIAMQHGPVPSAAYDIVKATVAEYSRCEDLAHARSAFDNQNNCVTPRREADLDYLSETDRECLDEAITEYGSLSFGKLRDLSHDEAYKATDENDDMTDEHVARFLPNAESVLGYLANG
jgi:uncharacterized phage-associated protein